MPDCSPPKEHQHLQCPPPSQQRTTLKALKALLDPTRLTPAVLDTPEHRHYVQQA